MIGLVYIQSRLEIECRIGEFSPLILAQAKETRLVTIVRSLDGKVVYVFQFYPSIVPFICWSDADHTLNAEVEIKFYVRIVGEILKVVEVGGNGSSLSATTMTC